MRKRVLKRKFCPAFIYNKVLIGTNFVGAFCKMSPEGVTYRTSDRGPDKKLHEKVEKLSESFKKSERTALLVSVSLALCGLFLAIGANYVWYVFEREVQRIGWWYADILGLLCLFFGFFFLWLVVKRVVNSQ